MKNIILKVVVCILTFFAALFVISATMNSGNTDMTAEMREASFPLIFMEKNGQRYNCLHGYAEEMNGSFQRDSITPLEADRHLSFVVEKFGAVIQEITFEVRSVDGERLVESTKVEEYEDEGTVISANIILKDLLEENTEYNLIILLKTDLGQTIRYYTRIIEGEGYSIVDKVDFALRFSESTFNDGATMDISSYLETNSTGNNTTFQKVDIHCAYSQINWGNLNVNKVSEPLPAIKELGTQTASIQLDYVVMIPEGSRSNYYNVQEYFRVRTGTERMFLLDYERTMNQIFNEEDNIFVNNKIMMGITDTNMLLEESEDGNIVAFVNENRLFSYNMSDNKLIYVYGFYDSNHNDLRTVYDANGIKILSVDETGNVRFLLYGYMNRGQHEGEVGVMCGYYDSMLNTVEEEIFIPYDKSFDLLEANISKLAYVNNTNQLYIYLDGAIYRVNLLELNTEVVADDLLADAFHVSADNEMVVWPMEEDIFDCSHLMMMNLNNGKQTEIEAGGDSRIMALGFMGEDVIYGIARRSDIVVDNFGMTTFPMYTVRIQNERGDILKTYEEPSVYVVDGRAEDNRITLKRVRKSEETGLYTSIEDDNILNNQIEKGVSNTIETVVTENFQTIVQVALKAATDSKSKKLLTPREVLYEGSREVAVETRSETGYYYVYGKNGIEGIYSEPANAINQAHTLSGVVVNDEGKYIWKRGNLSTKNQIMAITEKEITEEKNSLVVCLDTMMEYEGVIRNAEYLLARGGTVMSILQENLPEMDILDLSGCSLDAVLYYLNMDIPVLVLLDNGEAVLLIGYNEQNVVLMNPITGTIYKNGMNDSKTWFEENGNNFITYMY